MKIKDGIALLYQIDQQILGTSGTSVNFMYGDVNYFPGSNYLVIAVAHLHRLSQSQLPGFIERVSSLDGMKIESKPLPPNVPYDCPEVLAKVAMIGKPFEYMADRRPNGDLLGKVLREYGIPRELTEAYYSLVPLHLIGMKPIRNIDDMAREVVSCISSAKERCPDLNIDRAVANHSEILRALSSGKIGREDIDNFINAYGINHGFLIEYEFMQPDILDFRGRIKGRIGVLIGFFHAECVAAILDGNLSTQPLSWNLYKKTLPSDILTSVEAIEQLTCKD